MATQNGGAPREAPAAGAPAGGEGAQGTGPVRVEISKERKEMMVKVFDIVDGSVGIYIRMWLHVTYLVETPYGKKEFEKTLMRVREVKFDYEVEEEIEDALVAMQNEAEEYRQWLEEAVSKVIDTARKHGYEDIRVV